MNVTAGPFPPRNFIGLSTSGWKALAIWRVLRRLWSRINGTRGTGGEPKRSKTRCPLVAEHVDAALDGVLQRSEQRVPPGVGEVLRLVDDDRVEAVAEVEFGYEIGHLERKVALPELHGLVIAQSLVGPGGPHCLPRSWNSPT
ncbi:hypothetical protein TUM20985_27810 [Mycobacterium antarcticum]|nr:hypothetical protein TUM20985_27810 [Mycolicibacterium sp. TUM20985]GLP84209.1 hypothetical protein TUM20984_56290 [Mycolicibacterium sp. TUM20984]